MENTLLKQIGGTGELDRIGEYFYQRVLQDTVLYPFFEKTDVSQIRNKMVFFLKEVLEGRGQDFGVQIRKAHARLDISESHFNAFVGHLDMTLENDIGLETELIDDIIDIVIEAKDDVLNLKRKLPDNTFKKNAMDYKNNTIYKSLLENAPDAIVVTNESEEIILWNKAAEKLLDYKSASMIGQNFNRFVSSISKKENNALRVLSKEDRVEAYLLEGQSGNKALVSLSVSKIEEEGSHLSIIIMRNISKEKDELKGLLGLQRTVDSSYARIEFDAEGNILFANENFVEVLGYSSLDEIKGQHHSVFVEDTYRSSREYLQFWKDLRKGHTQEGEFKRIKKTGENVWIQAAYTPVTDENNQVIKVIKIATDITKQKNDNINMQGLRDTVDTSYAQIEFDARGNILFANENFVRTLGYSRAEEIIGRHHSIFVEREYRNSQEYISFWRELGSGITHQGEFKRITQYGDEVWIQAAYTPVKNEKGVVAKIIKIATDVTAQKKLLLGINEVIVSAGGQGNLSARLDISKATGDWKALGNSVNQLLESVANPVMEIKRLIECLALGDLTERFELESKGDIKVLGDSLNTAIENMNLLLSQISQIGNLVAASAEEMLTKGEEMKNTTQEVASATQQMAEGAQEQAQQTDEASKLMDDLLKSANGMADKATLINKAAEEGQNSSVEGLSTIKLVVENMLEIQASASSTSESILILSERSEEIASALSVITDIAAQTNLLALNAAIEAARAGDAGRGFAVVAEEIRKLAEGSRKSAIDIEKVIREVQKDINAASKAIETMESSVKSGTSASKEAEDVFGNIETASNDTLSLSKEIVEATDVQKGSINTTAKNIEKIVVVAEETASGTEQVASSSKVLSQGMNEVTATSEDLANIANQLQESISKFKL